MKKMIKKLIASICVISLVTGSLSTLGSASDVNSSLESTAVQMTGYKHMTTSSFYQGDEKMPDTVSVDGGAGSTDTVAVYSTVKDMQGNVIENHNRTLLSLKVHFENDTSSYHTRLEVAGKEDNSGFRMYPEVGKLRLEGIGGIQSDASVFRIATDPLTSFAEEFILQMSFEYGDFDGESNSNDVKVGVYINGALGTVSHEAGDNAAVADNYAIFYDCDLTKLGTYMKLYTENGEDACDLSVAAYVPENTNLTELTWSDFNLISNGTETPAVDKEFTPENTPSDHSASTYILNKAGIEKFENTSLELEVKFNTDAGVDKIYLGGSSTWYGVMFYPTGSGDLALVNNTSLSPDFGLANGVLEFNPTVAKLTDKDFLNDAFVLKITTEYGDYDEDGASDDAQLGFYFDGNLYNSQYCYVNNYKSSHLTGNYIAIEAGNGVTVKSVVDTASVVTADVLGVYKGSNNGQVQFALEADGSVALPTSATYFDIGVTVSDGTTATNYQVDGTLREGILSLDLTDKIVTDATNVITLKAGTYSGMNDNKKAYLKLEDDFVCYQDKTSGVIYQKLGNTKLEAGQNFNGGTPADGDLYLVGTDLTGNLQGFTEGYTHAGGEWWTIVLEPLNEESGVFRQTAGGESVRMQTSEYQVKYPTEGNTQYYINVGNNKADGDVFTIKGQFKVVKSDDSYKDYLNVIEIEESMYQYANGQWSVYVGPWIAEAEVTGVCSGSSAGTVKLALSVLESTTLPATGTCTDINVTVSDGTTEISYNVVEGTIADGIFTLNLSDKIVAGTTNEITIKAGTYHGTTDERALLLTLKEDFTCYQDGETGMVYELIGSTELVPGYQYNTEAADGGLYVTGDDYTELLPVQPAGGWQTKLDPINNNSGIFVKSADGTEARIDSKDLLYYVNSKTQYYCNMNGVIQSGDILTIKGQFRVIGRWDATYHDSHLVLNIQESKYQYVDGIWMWLTAPQATVELSGEDGTSILLNSSIPFERTGTDETAKIRAMEHAECGVFLNDVKQEDAYLYQTSTQELKVVIDTIVEHGDKITIKGAFWQNEETDQFVQQVVNYAETSFWYGVDIVSNNTDDTTTSGWYDILIGTYVIKGDMNADGEIDIRDIIRIKRWYEYGGKVIPVKNTTINKTITHLSQEADVVAELSDMILTADLVMPIMASNGPMVHGYTSLNENVPENFLTDYYFQMIVDAGINTISVTENDYARTSHEQDGIKTGLKLSEKFGLGYYLTDSQIIGPTNYNTTVDSEVLATRLQEYSHYKSFRGLVGVDEPNSEDYRLDYEVDKRVSGYNGLMTALRKLNVDDITCLYPCYDSTLMDGYKKYVNEYCEVFKPNLLRYDNYPFESEGTNPLNLYFWNMSVIRHNAKNNNIPFGVTVQAGGQWIAENDTYVATVTPLYPNEGQFKWNVNTCLAFGTKAVSYFTLLQPYHFSNALDAEDNKYQDFRRSGLIGMDGIKNQWYDYAKDCNEQIAAIDSVLMASESKGVIACGSASADMDLITSDTSVSDCILSTGAYQELKEVDGDALIGYFDYKGKTALYVVNYQMDSEQTVTLTFEHELYDINQITMIKDAVKTVEEENLGTLVLEMEAGEGILLVIQ